MNKINVKYKKVYILLFSFLVSLSLVLPTNLQAFKILLLFIVLATLIRNKIIFDKELFIISIFFSLLGFLYTIFGLFQSNLGALATITVMCIYPILFFYLTNIFKEIEDVLIIRKVIIISSIVIICLQLSYIMSAFHIIPLNIYNYYMNFFSGSVGFSSDGDNLFFSLPNVSSFIFIVPFFATYILLSKKIDKTYLFLFIISLLLILLTGRRAFFLSFFISIIFLLVVSFSLRYYIPNKVIKNLFKYSLVVFLFLLISVYLSDINLEMYFKKFYSIFNFSDNESNLERVYQFNALFEGISNAPLFGNGAGAVASYIRSYEQPWAYELSYIALIFQYGIFGFTLYVLGIMYIFYKLIYICKDPNISIDMKRFILAFMTGMISFLVANATNPYLMKFDYMWVVFIPVMIINAYKIEKRKQLAKNI